MIRTFQYKLYPNTSQAKTLDRWLRSCCWVYNRALEHRIKAYKRRGESVNYNDQQKMLTEWRGRMDWLRLVPSEFSRDALRRVDRGMMAFFRRVKTGEKPGFPRFRSWHRYNSLEYSAVGNYLGGDRIRVPKLGLIRCRGRLLPVGSQKILRVIKRASGWYAQIVLEDGKEIPQKTTSRNSVGVDVGLSYFATLSTGEKIDNPRWLQRDERKLCALQRRVSRRRKGSSRRRKASRSLARYHELISYRRRNFCHAASTRLIREFDVIGFEDLNIGGMSRGRLGKSILDAAWGIFGRQLTCKAEYAGKWAVPVNPRGTSQECPACGRVVPKKLSERTHSCPCGLTCDRDHASGLVIEARALTAIGVTRPWREPTSVPQLVAAEQVGPMKREDRTLTPVVS